MSTDLVLYKPFEVIPYEKKLVRVTAAIHPLQQTRTFRYVEEGTTLQEIIDIHCPIEFRDSIFCTVNGIIVDRTLWGIWQVFGTDIVVIRAVPQGSGAGKFFRTLLMVATIAIAVFTGNPLLAMAFNIVGNLVLNALIPPSRGASSNGGLPQYTFGVQGITNQELPYGVMPRIYGRTLMTPPKGAHSYTVTANSEQYLYALFDLGPGPIKITDIQIGQTPIDSFTGITYEVMEGRLTDPELTIYTNAVHQTPLSIGLPNQEDEATQRTNAGVTNISVDITFPGGLFGVNSNGDFQNNTQTFRIRALNIETSGFAVNNVVTMTGNSSSAQAQSFDFGPFVAPGQFDVTVERLDAPPAVKNGSANPYWTALRDWGPQTAPLLPKTNAKIAVKILATQQLNGDIADLNCIAQSYLQVYDGSSWTEQLTTHPAWVAYDVLTGTANARNLDASRVDTASLLEWATVYPSAEFNYTFGDRTTIWQALRLVGSAGRATPIVRDGLYSFIFDRIQDNPVQMFTARNVSNFKATKQFMDEVDGMEIRYISETMGWQQHSVYSYADGITAETADYNKVSTIDLTGVTSDDWAFKLGSYFFAAGVERTTTYQFDTDLDHLACNPGDRIWVQHDVIDSGLGSGRIREIDRDGSGHVTAIILDETLAGNGSAAYAIYVRTAAGGLHTTAISAPSSDGQNVFSLTSAYNDGADDWQIGDLVAVSSTATAMLDAVVKVITPQSDFKATLTCLDYAPGIHSGDSAVVPPVVNDRIDRFIHSLPVSSINIVEITADEDSSQLITGGSAIPRIHGYFVPTMDGIPATLFEVQWKLEGDTGWQAMPPLPPDAREFFIPISIVAIGSTYDIRVRGTNASQTNPGPWALASITIADYLIPPAAPANLEITPIISGVNAVITAGDGRTPPIYRLYINDTFDLDTADLAYQGAGNAVTIPGLSAIVLYSFWATTVNEYGVESEPIGPITGLPLPIGYDALTGDIAEFLQFLADAARDHSDLISDLSQALTSIGLGNRVDFQTVTSGYIAADGHLFDDLTDGYNNAITVALAPLSSVITDVTALQATLVGFDGSNTVADAVTVLQTETEQNGEDIASNSSAITGLQSALTGYNGADAVATAFTNLQTQVTTNAGDITIISADVTSLTSALNGYTDADAVSTAVTSLQTQITTNGTDISTLSTDITTLESALTGYTGASAVSNAISGLQTQVTTNGTDITTNASAITSIQSAISGYTTPNALSTALTSITTSVTSLSGTVTAQATALTALTSQVGNTYASGLFRVTTSATPSGADARIALEVAASSGGSPYAAAIYLDAMSGGTSRITCVANQFFITDGTSTSSPFLFSGGSLFLNSAYIQSLTASKIIGGTLDVDVINAGSITTNHLQANAVTDVHLTTATAFGTSWDGAEGFTWTTSGGAVSVTVVGPVVFVASASFTLVQASGGGVNAGISIVRSDGTTIGSGGGGQTPPYWNFVGFETSVMTCSFVTVDFPPSGTYTYTLMVSGGADGAAVSPGLTSTLTCNTATMEGLYWKR